MRADFRKRLADLEALPRPDELPTPPPGWRLVGRGLVVPNPVPLDEWDALAAAAQAELMRSESVWMDELLS